MTPVRSLGLGMLLVAACSSSAPRPAEPSDPDEALAPLADDPDAGASLDDLRLAAFAKVIQDTEGLRHECWARGAADDYRLAGRVVLAVQLGAGGMPTDVKVDSDDTGDAVLTECLVAAYRQHRWPPVFDPGTTVKAPLQFDVPSGQYTVSQEHVSPRTLADGKLVVTPLLHRANTGNAGASMSLLTITGGMDVAPHRHTSAEILVVLSGQGLAYDVRGRKRGVQVAAGDIIYIPAGKDHAFLHTGEAPFEALQLYAPGGPEGRFLGQGSAGTTALTDKELARPPRTVEPLKIISEGKLAPLAIAGGKGWVKLGFDAASAGDGAAYVGAIGMQSGVTVPTHVHDGSTELLYVRAGTGVMTVGALEYPVTAGMAVQIPPGVEHGFTATSEVEAVQFYSPSGPEQRFKPQK